MTLQSRLQKVTHGLSPLQRAVLVLQALRQGRQPEPALGHFDDPAQRRAFHRYMGLLFAIERELGSALLVLSERVEALAWAADHHRVFSQAASYVEEYEGLPEPVKLPRDWRTEESLTVPLLLRGLAKDMRDYVVAGLVARWQELQALEAVWAELAEEFEGEDPVLPEQRARADATAASLRDLAARLAYRRALPGPDEELLDAYRRHVNAAFLHLGLMEPYQ